MFHGVASGRLRLPAAEAEVHLHDVETLNRLAMSGTFDVTKASFHAYLLVREAYQLLPVAAALGFGCGPLVVTKGEIERDDLPHCRIAVPGELTTAHLLLRLWAPEAGDKVFVPYDRVMGMVANGTADAGVIIHEGRFVYEREGLKRLVDLGAWWEQQTSLPIPLGCILARRGLGDDLIREIETLLRESIANAIAHPEATYGYVREHAQEIDDDVLDKHIKTFVNEYSLDLGESGRAAVAKLETMAREAGVIT